ncbi:hypothetical protein [Nocardia sp. CDC160]|uniref:hypothetical protein n=1 Tax=Nocardia sp. CDC160 TaxID=3112166 RepID=UPI002DBB2F5F|nr:hypothetical protein [Nocardia sp. CDC160]MEC3920206.1 hypothetical protein [Nocardia sp. CDC160]
MPDTEINGFNANPGDPVGCAFGEGVGLGSDGAEIGPFEVIAAAHTIPDLSSDQLRGAPSGPDTCVGIR